MFEDFAERFGGSPGKPEPARPSSSAPRGSPGSSTRLWWTWCLKKPSGCDADEPHHDRIVERMSQVLKRSGAADSKTSVDLSLGDLAFASPYNTYLHVGLPPGPIANPSLDAMVAAIFPEVSPYLYYLSAPDGTTVFSRTFEEHKIAKAIYLQ